MRRKVLFTMLGIIVVAIAAMIVYYFVYFQLVRVPTASMSNTVIPGDHLIVKKRGYGQIRRGDIIVHKYPGDVSTNYLSRVVGLPGEIIQVRDKIIYINHQALDEQRVTVDGETFHEGDQLEELSMEGAGAYRVFYLPREYADTVSETEFGTASPFEIPTQHYFVMGDNRDNSEDSRFRGSVPGELVFGKAQMIYWSSKPDDSGNETMRWERMFAELK